MTNRTPTTPTEPFQKREYVFKILVVGDPATGKTCIVKRTVQNSFSENYKATVGVDFALKILKTNDGNLIRVQLWDIAGQERFGNMTRVYYRDAVGCLIVYDLTRQTTFDAVARWKIDVDNKIELPNGDRIPCLLLANKCDLIKDDTTINTERLDNYCRENGFAKWFETSAQENINIEVAIQYLIGLIMKNSSDPLDRLKFPTPSDDTIKLRKKTKKDDTNRRKDNNSGGCCS